MVSGLLYSNFPLSCFPLRKANSVWPHDIPLHTITETLRIFYINKLLLHLQIMPVSVAPIRSWMLNFVSSRIITDFRKVPIIIHMFCPFANPAILLLEVWEFLTALILIMQIHETALKDMTNLLAH